MSKEKDFHKLIRQQNVDEKESAWNRIEQQNEEVVIELGTVLGKKRFFSKKNIILICSAIFFLILAVTIIIITLPNNQGNDVGDGTGNGTIDDKRYCEFSDYYVVESELSIEQYSDANNLQILYFKDYAECEYYTDYVYKLKSSDEIICLNEELMNQDGYIISQHVTDSKTEIDFLNIYTNICTNTTTINSIEVKWGTSTGSAYARFAYKNFKYFLKIDELTEINYLTELIGNLIR